jgi:hypothetical protein
MLFMRMIFIRKEIRWTALDNQLHQLHQQDLLILTNVADATGARICRTTWQQGRGHQQRVGGLGPWLSGWQHPAP